MNYDIQDTIRISTASGLLQSISRRMQYVHVVSTLTLFTLTGQIEDQSMMHNNIVKKAKIRQQFLTFSFNSKEDKENDYKFDRFKCI